MTTKKGYPRGGWKPLPPEEKKVPIVAMVKAKHYVEATKEIKALIEKYR